MSISRCCEICLIVVGTVVVASGFQQAWFRAMAPSEDAIVSQLLKAAVQYRASHESAGFYAVAEQFKHRWRYQAAIGAIIIALGATCCIAKEVGGRSGMSSSTMRPQSWAFSGSLAKGVVIGLQLVTLLIGSVLLVYSVEPLKMAGTAGLASNFILVSTKHPSAQWEALFRELVRYYSSVPFSRPIAFGAGGAIIVLNAICICVEWVAGMLGCTQAHRNNAVRDIGAK